MCPNKCHPCLQKGGVHYLTSLFLEQMKCLYLAAVGLKQMRDRERERERYRDKETDRDRETDTETQRNRKEIKN